MSLQSNAHYIVNVAIQKGTLPALDGSISCVDCGKTAVHYDHRDYRKPLDVQPVCRSCNQRRGSAIGWKYPSDYGRLIVRKVPVSLLRGLRATAASEGISLRDIVLRKLNTKENTSHGKPSRSHVK